MTSINAIGNSPPPPPPRDRADMDSRMSKALSGVADLLGMSTDEIKAAQKNGTTLDDLAKQKGVSEDKLTSTLAEGLKESAPADAPTNIDFTKMATDIAAGKGPGGHHHHHGQGMSKLSSDGSNTASGDLQSLLSNYGIDSSKLQDLLSSSSPGSSTDTSSTDGNTADFVTQLKSLMAQYGSKGLSYDAKA